MADERDVVVDHYTRGDDEQNRLTQGGSRLEFARTQELLKRFLPPPPGQVLDIGGGPGAYALWLSRSGYRVHLLDVTPLHVEQARELSQRHGDAFTAEVGDARRLLAAEGTFDAALLLGPLYHLVDRADRVRALQEARRVVRPGGLVVAAGISRLASLVDGVRLGFILDPRFQAIVRRDLEDGQHRNPDRRPGWFTTSYFHQPADLEREVSESGLDLVGVFGVEGPGWLRPDLWDDPDHRDALLLAARLIETDRDAVGLSAHLLAVATRRHEQARSQPGHRDGE